MYLSFLLPAYQLFQRSQAGGRMVPYLSHQFSLKSYQEIFGNNRILLPIFVSLARAFFGTVITVICCSMFAYLVTQKELPHRKGIYKYVVITMYLNAGMIPG